MKRHTLFIYIAALLTMLGTALPMSAQNKSFTVNRNDGASQKYSYSQGDRLVLSREDSQGKKYADFVEQQVYVGNDVHNIPLTSIESITFDTQATVDEGKTFVIQESGGKIEYGNIIIDFPSGTFNSATKVSVIDMDKGSVDGEYELSKFCTMQLSGGIRKNFKIAVKAERASNDEQVKMQFITPGFIASESCMGPALSVFDVSYIDGAYVAEMPAMDDPDNAEEAIACFGLLSYITLNEESSTRAIDSKYDISLSTPTIPLNASPSTIGQINTVNDKLKTEWIPAAINMIYNLGFRLDKERKIPYVVKDDMGDEKWGEHVLSAWGVPFSRILLNGNKVYKLGASGNPEELQKTLIHETLHYFQQNVYDLRSNAKMGREEPTTALILDEATAVWSERFFGSKLSDITLKNLPFFVASINPEIREIHDRVIGMEPKWWNKFALEVDGWNHILWKYVQGWEKRYETVGYGMSALIEYLSQKCGDDVVLKMYNLKKDSKDPKNTIGFVEAVVKDKINIFTQVAYKDFIKALGCKEVYDDINFTQLLRNDKKFNIVVDSPQTVNFKNTAYGYGALIEQLGISSVGFEGGQDTGLDNVSCIIKQTVKGLRTWVFGYKNQEFYEIGQTANGSKLDISNTFYKTLATSLGRMRYGSLRYYLVTIPDDKYFKTTGKIQSNIEVKIEDMVTPRELSFSSDGGKETLKVFSEATSFAAKPDADWITVKENLSKKTIDVSVSESTTARNGFVTVEVMNDKSETIKTVKIPVKQEGVVFKVEADKPLEFEAEGGTVTLTVTTNQPQWSVTKKTGDWFNYSTSGNKLTVTAFANPTSDPRDGYLEICALNEKNEKVSEPVTIKVKQKGKVVVKLQMSLHINIALFDGRSEQDLKPIVVNLSNDENKTEVVVSRKNDDDGYQVMCKGEDSEISFDSDADIINDMDKLKSGKVEIRSLSCMRNGRFSLVASGSSGNSYEEKKNSITYGWGFGTITSFHDNLTGATLPSPSGKWIVTGGVSITRPK